MTVRTVLASLTSALVLPLVLLSTLDAPTSAQTQTPPRRTIAITVDDLPASQGDLAEWQSLTPQLVGHLKSLRVPAVGFVNESKVYRRGEIDARVNLLRQWVDAGLELGNHTFSHINIDQAGVDAYTEDVVRGETITRGLLREKNLTLRYFRHPYLRTGPTPEQKQALDAFLARRGYVVAPVTVDNSDFIFAVVYAKAKARGDRAVMTQVRDTYVSHMDEALAFFEKLSLETLGREIPQVLLIHANTLNAETFPALATMMQKRGYAFVTLEEALKDEAYRLPEASSPRGLSWLHRWRLAKGLPMRWEADPPPFIMDAFTAAQTSR